MSWTNVSQTYATPQHKNAWASLPGQGWRRINPDQADGVTNVLVLLALAKATNQQAHVTQDSSNRITHVYY